MSRLEREAQTLKRVGEDIFRLQVRASIPPLSLSLSLSLHLSLSLRRPFVRSETLEDEEECERSPEMMGKEGEGGGADEAA